MHSVQMFVPRCRLVAQATSKPLLVQCQLHRKRLEPGSRKHRFCSWCRSWVANFPKVWRLWECIGKSCNASLSAFILRLRGLVSICFNSGGQWPRRPVPHGGRAKAKMATRWGPEGTVRDMIDHCASCTLPWTPAYCTDSMNTFKYQDLGLIPFQNFLSL